MLGWSRTIRRLSEGKNNYHHSEADPVYKVRFCLPVFYSLQFVPHNLQVWNYSFIKYAVMVTTMRSSLTFLFLKACLARFPLQAAWNREMFLLVWTSRCSSSLDRVPALKKTCRTGRGDTNYIPFLTQHKAANVSVREKKIFLTFSSVE